MEIRPNTHLKTLKQRNYLYKGTLISLKGDNSFGVVPGPVLLYIVVFYTVHTCSESQSIT